LLNLEQGSVAGFQLNLIENFSIAISIAGKNLIRIDQTLTSDFQPDPAPKFSIDPCMNIFDRLLIEKC
jgi:hypothetical protein